jgi:phosphinothricin acetyltransferase
MKPENSECWSVTEPDGLLIRLATPDDAAEIAAIYEPVVRETAISFETVPPDAAEMASRITSYLEDYPWLVGCIDGRIAGYVYASQHRSRAAYRWSCDVTVYVHSDFRRRGIGGRLYRQLFSLLERQHYHVAWAGIALPNPGSIAVHESVGFSHIGTFEEVGYKFGKWHAVGWWRRRLADAGSEAIEPIPFRDLDL